MSTNTPTTERFRFGENWSHFLDTIDEKGVRLARESLLDMLQVADLKGKRFLDIGCGSGLFSLGARQAGARVYSFDYDYTCVECADELRRRHYPDDPDWHIKQGSILDKSFVDDLGTFDVVYAWGVLHHTGNMRAAMDNVARLLKPNGSVYVALYNDQGIVSEYWTMVKVLYNKVPWLRPVLRGVYAPYFIGARFAVRLLTGRVRLERGMSYWYDMVDWLGGYPFEVATPSEVVAFYKSRGFDDVLVKSCGRRSGCNEYLFQYTGWADNEPTSESPLV